MQATHSNVRLVGLCLCVLGIASWLTGCARSEPGSDDAVPRVGLINLDKVAQETGRNTQIEQQFRQRLGEATEQIRTHLEELQNQANSEIARMSERFGPSPTPEQQREILGVQQQARASAERLRLELNQRQQVIVAELRRQFRDEIRPTLNEVAEERGVALVLTLDDGVMSFDPALDLTDAVIARLQPAPAEPAQP